MVETKLRLISEIAKQGDDVQLNNLMRLFDQDGLRECFYMLKKNKAPGIDGVTFEAYAQDLEANLADLVYRMKRFSYQPQPVRRTYIPKSDGGERPLGIPALEDKIVQLGISRILTVIYEPIFLDCSFGYRPGLSCHGALDRLDKIIMTLPTNHIIDADLKGFFDHVDHDHLIDFLSIRINDKHLLRYIVRFLKAGIMEDGMWQASEVGTPQGGNMSPLLANIYLHYVLDKWLDEVVRPHCRGKVEMVRFADDFVICVQFKDDAVRILPALTKRLAKYGLTLSPDKTKQVEFGRYAEKNARHRNQKPDTFDFLSITHFCDKTRKGGFKVGRTTKRKRFRESIQKMNTWLKSVRSCVLVQDWWPILCSKLRGHYQYYGVSGNYRGIQRFYFQTVRLVFKWLNRRSQKKSFNWDQFNRYLTWYPLPKPKICHNLYTLYGY